LKKRKKNQTKKKTIPRTKHEKAKKKPREPTKAKRFLPLPLVAFIYFGTNSA